MRWRSSWHRTAYQVCRELVRHCTDPQTEVLEYLRRDVANLALGNKDNHARNTAVQRDAYGRIALTPLYDFAPMYLHPDGIARRIHWTDNDGGRPDWRRVLDSVCEQGESPRRAVRRGGSARLQRAPLAAGLRAMAPLLAQLASERDDGHGLDADVIAHLRPGIRAQAAALAELE